MREFIIGPAKGRTRWLIAPYGPKQKTLPACGEGRMGATRAGRSLEGRRRDVRHVQARAGLWPRLGPADFTAQIGGGGCGLRQRYGQTLLILGSAARELPCGDVVGDALIALSRRGHHIVTRRYGKADRQALCDYAFALNAVVPQG